MNFEHVSDSVDCIDMQVEWMESEGYVNKEVCVNIELFLLVFVHEKSPRRAFAAREWMSYGFLWIFAKYLTGVGCWRLASMVPLIVWGRLTQWCYSFVPRSCRWLILLDNSITAFAFDLTKFTLYRLEFQHGRLTCGVMASKAGWTYL